jgi:MinD superfamily P-loop ATPase
MSQHVQADQAGSRRQVTVALASGKGGTGKTLVSSQLARALAARGTRVLLVDADVEEPNAELLLRPQDMHDEPFCVTATAIDPQKCTRCGGCAEVCAFGAVLVGQHGMLTVPEHCRNCGACEIRCEEGAIQHYRRQVGVVRQGRAGDVAFAAGELKVGEHRAVPLIDELRDRANGFDGIVIVDCPPGTSCSAASAIRGADLALLVTEPTPFGAHDLRLAAGLCEALGVPARVVVNRAGLSGMRLDSLLQDLKLRSVAEIPFDEGIAAAHATGQDPMLCSEALRQAVEALVEVVEGVAA